MIFKKDTDDVLYNDAKSLLKQGLANILDGNMLNDETLIRYRQKYFNFRRSSLFINFYGIKINGSWKV